MKMPKDISASELIKCISILGYERVTQKGSHIKITTEREGQHHLAIPNHAPIKIGTLHAIIRQVALHFGKTKEEIIVIIFS